jgi:two-component system chemotaxis response regulator CheY
MSKKVVLVGHCGPDSSYLTSAVRKAEPAAEVIVARGMDDLQRHLDAGVDLILFNRLLEYGYEEEEGVALLARLREAYPGVAMMLVSNYADAQAAAVAAGALPGFGKREIGSARVTQLLRDAMRSSADNCV